MTPDDVYESEAYFNRKHDPDKAEARERLKAKRELNAPEEKPSIDRRKVLRKIIASPVESVSTRQDARRLLEIYDLRPKDFQREYDDFLAWRSETRK